MTYKDKKSWDDGAEALSTLRLGESEIAVDPRPESRGAGFTVKHRKGVASFRAKSKDEAAEWMTVSKKTLAAEGFSLVNLCSLANSQQFVVSYQALRALQYAEMVQWSSSHICRWLEAHSVEDDVLHRVHECGVSGQFFARTVASNEYDRATSQLKQQASLSGSDATAIIDKLKAAQLGSSVVSEWLEEAHRDVHGKSSAIKQAAALLHSPGARLTSDDEGMSTTGSAMVPTEPAGPGKPRAHRSSGGDAELEARDAKIKQDLALVSSRIAGRSAGAGSPAGTSHQRFDPKKWQEDQDHKEDLIKQKKLRKEQEELATRQAQTREDKLAARYPRGQGVYDSASGNPDFSKVQSKYKKEAAQYRDKVVERTVTDSATAGRTITAAPAAPVRVERVPTAKSLRERDPKIVPVNTTGNDLATKLESLIAVHRNLQEHQDLVDIITKRLREEDGKRLSTQKELAQKKRKEQEYQEKHRETRRLEQECEKYEKTARALQAANEGALERYNLARKHMKDAGIKREEAVEQMDKNHRELDVQKEHVKVLTQKLKYQTNLLRDQKMEAVNAERDRERSFGGGGGGGGGEGDEEMRAEIDRLKQQVEREKRKANVAKHEAQERGKVLVGAAAKLEQEQMRFESMKGKLEKKIVSAQSEGRREGAQDGERDLSELKQHIHNATEMVFEITEALGMSDGSRFKDQDEMGRHELIKAVKEAVMKSGKQTEVAKKQKDKVRLLEGEVKELRKHLKREQDESYKMLDELHQAKTLCFELHKSDNLLEVIRKGARGGGGGGGDGSELAQLQRQVSVHESQLEAERRRTQTAKEETANLQQQLRRSKHDVQQHQEQAEDASRHVDQLSRVSRADGRLQAERLRAQRQETRLKAMHAGMMVYKHHESKTKTESRHLQLTADNKMLTYGKSATKGVKNIPIEDIRYIHFGFCSENMSERHASVIETPEWMCFGIVLRTKTVDFSAETEEDCALWVTGLRTLLEMRRGDVRGQEVGRFFWARAAMKTKSRAQSEGRSHMQFLADKVKGAADTWWDAAPAAHTISRAGMSGSMSFAQSSRNRLVGVGGGAMSPNRLSYGSPTRTGRSPSPSQFSVSGIRPASPSGRLASPARSFRAGARAVGEARSGYDADRTARSSSPYGSRSPNIGGGRSPVTLRRN